MQTIALQYIGKKPRQTDTVAKTGIVWNGPGDVQRVPILEVSKFLAHPMVWAVHAPGAGLERIKPADGDPVPAEVKAEAVMTDPLNEMDKAQLVAYAESIGIKLDKRRTVEALREKIRGAR
jgi:hypothetical protein